MGKVKCCKFWMAEDGKNGFVTVNDCTHLVMSKWEGAALLRRFEVRQSTPEQSRAWLDASEALFNSPLPRQSDQDEKRLGEHYREHTCPCMAGHSGR